MGDCSSCGHDLRPAAKYCDQCGVRVTTPAGERAHVTVLCGELTGFERGKTVVERYGGTVEDFTGDGFRAVFGAPHPLHDHALCACLAALDLQALESGRFGLNSGDVIVGESATGYTALGHLIETARRMQAAAPPGGVLLSNTTALLVADRATLGPLLLIDVKGDDNPAPAHRLLSVTDNERLNYG